MWILFQKAQYISEIFLPFAFSAFHIKICPAFPFYDIFQGGHFQVIAKHLFEPGLGNKCLIKRIGLKLNAKS
jgi:hypothetical protein